MSVDTGGFFDRNNPGLFFGLDLQKIKFKDKKDELFFEKLNEEFEIKKTNIISFLKDIRHLPRNEQATNIKRNYGTKNITSKICFYLLDAKDLNFPAEMQKQLFDFCSKFLDI